MIRSWLCEGKQVSARSLAVWCALTAVLLAAVLLGATSAYVGSASLVLPFLRGDHYAVYPLLVDLGECEPGTTQVATFTVTSLVRRPCRLVGSVEDCSCLTTDKLPISLEPLDRRVISIKVFMPKVPADFSQSALLFFDDGELGVVTVQVRGRTGHKSVAAAERPGEKPIVCFL